MTVPLSSRPRARFARSPLTVVCGAAVLGVLAAGFAPAASAASATSDTASGQRENSLAVGDLAFVDVAVATLWSQPGLARAIDAPALSNPVDLRAWNLNLQHTASREWLSDGSKLETQALLGTPVQVTAVDGDWVKVVVEGQPTPRDERGYPGWVPAVQLVENTSYDTLRATGRRAVVTGLTTWLSKDSAARNRTTEISFNTELPVVGSRPGRVKVALPDGSRRWVSAGDVDVRTPDQQLPRPSGQDIVDTGSRFLGLRYLWAGVSAFGFDCSGFTHTVFRAHGITIPRDSGPQSRSGEAVARENLRPGDLVFFAGPGGVGRVHHVAIYAGDGTILHSPNSARNVELVDLDRFDVDKEYAGARRYL